MNLAKIRRKFSVSPAPVAPVAPDALPGPSAETEITDLEAVWDEPGVEAAAAPTAPPSASAIAAPVLLDQGIPPRRSEPFDPLQVLLAGREASGCNEDSQLTAADQAPAARSDHGEFLCFRVSDETYGISIMQIKEIIKPRPVTEVPRAPSFVAGVISLRGVIIPVIDMIGRLGLSHERTTGKERVVVVKTGEEYAGLLVDEVVQVVRIPLRSIEPTPAVLDGIDRDFVNGIGRADARMVILLNVESIADINLF